MATRGTADEGRRDDRESDHGKLSCAGWGAGIFGLGSMVCLFAALVSPTWSVHSAAAPQASVGLFQICASIKFYSSADGEDIDQWVCANTYSQQCSFSICSAVSGPNGAVVQCSNYYIFYPDGFQNTPASNSLISPNITLTDPSMVFPGDGNCDAYNGAKSTAIMAVLFCLIGFFCAPFTCCYHRRKKETLWCAVAMFTLALICAIISVAVWATEIFNPETSGYGSGFWLMIAAICCLVVTIPLVALAPGRAKDDIPPFGAGGYPYQNPDAAGLHATHETKPDPPVAPMASSNYPQPGNNYGRGPAKV